ncbi:hypothetical protein DPMN_115521 [Dreissena polymorpha]|uniref:Uncharacterized protein n=1 Tax=Dreissena polymorpha TaxID=45954 RepID=A0A9D4KLE6_DREPO|nr:hypothetical protein DPMN_115521 [Dreissena polymorpha]
MIFFVFVVDTAQEGMVGKETYLHPCSIVVVTSGTSTTALLTTTGVCTVATRTMYIYIVEESD